ncbi:MAG: ABC transporter ATP-binding protein [Steroidobacteraceae bacterium]
MCESSAMNAPLVAQSLWHTYGAHSALRGVDLAVAPGSVLGLIGRNGASKSTLIEALVGLLVPSSGRTFVLGEPALKLSDRVKERLAYVPQQPQAYPWLTGAQMLDVVGRFYPHWDGEFVRATLSRWDVPADRPLGRLSPGERQRIELIRALAARPQVLVLDEPAGALDPVARRDLLREVALLAGEAGSTVLFSTHIVSDLERIASQIALLHDGRLLLHCDLDDTKERYARLWLPPQHAGAAPTAVLSRRAQSDGSVTVVIGREPDGDWPALVRLAGARLDALGLEDLFVEIVA